MTPHPTLKENPMPRVPDSSKPLAERLRLAQESVRSRPPADFVTVEIDENNPANPTDDALTLVVRADASLPDVTAYARQIADEFEVHVSIDVVHALPPHPPPHPWIPPHLPPHPPPHPPDFIQPHPPDDFMPPHPHE
jgi:hypothetical protein